MKYIELIKEILIFNSFDRIKICNNINSNMPQQKKENVKGQ